MTGWAGEDEGSCGGGGGGADGVGEDVRFSTEGVGSGLGGSFEGDGGSGARGG